MVCPELFTGSNCSVTWKDSIDPAFSILNYINVAAYSLCILNNFFILSQTLKSRALNKSILSDRFALDVSVICSNFGYGVFFLLGAGFEYSLSEWQGKLCIIGCCFGFFGLFNAGIYFTIMYISILNASITQNGYFERFDIAYHRKRVRVLQFPAWIALIIFASFVLSEQITSIALMWRVLLGISLWSIPIGGLFGPYIWMKATRVLDDIIRSNSKDGSGGSADQKLKSYKKLSRQTKLISLHLASVAVGAEIAYLVAVIIDVVEYDYFLGYLFVYVTITAASVGGTFLYIYQFKEGSLKNEVAKRINSKIEGSKRFGSKTDMSSASDLTSASI